MEENLSKEKRSAIGILARVLLVVFSLLLLFIMVFASVFTFEGTMYNKNLSFGPYQVFIMRTEAHPDIAKRGDLVITKKTRLTDFQVGDSFVYDYQDKFYYCSEIKTVKEQNSVKNVVVAESQGKKYEFESDEIDGKVIKVIPTLGDTIDFLRIPIMIFFISLTLIILLLIVLKIF